jgi:Asp-tRNA(Asn)/Glu-tRNA(Gln) amidotransferase A subunit family amidase
MVGEHAELRALSVTEVAHAIGRSDLDPVAVVAAHVAGLEGLEGFNAIITSCAERAIERARSGLAGPLAGVPIIVKDLFDTAEVRTTYGSSIYRDHVPRRTAEAVASLEAAGAVVIAKANLHEFAWGTTSQNPHWGYVGNPTRPGRVAGGSSGGNAAALAAGVGLLGLGTDTAGSVRIPSACCGTVGFKPTHGAVSMDGCRPLSPSFDVAGPMARTVADCALAYSVLSGEPLASPRLQGLTIGVLDEPPPMAAHDPGGPPASGHGADISARLRELEALGARLTTAAIEPPQAEILPLMLAEAAAGHADTFPSRRQEYGEDTRLKWDAARAVPADAVQAARTELPRWRKAASAATQPDLFVSPTLAGEVPALDVWEPDVRVEMVGYTRTFSFLGWPAIAIGDLQLAGRDATKVLGAALAWEAEYGAAR